MRVRPASAGSKGSGPEPTGAGLACRRSRHRPGDDLDPGHRLSTPMGRRSRTPGKRSRRFFRARLGRARSRIALVERRFDRPGGVAPRRARAVRAGRGGDRESARDRAHLGSRHRQADRQRDRLARPAYRGSLFRAESRRLRASGHGGDGPAAGPVFLRDKNCLGSRRRARRPGGRRARRTRLRHRRQFPAVAS